MARVTCNKSFEIDNHSTYHNLKSNIHKDFSTLQEDIKPVIKRRKFIESGTVIDLENCITTTFDEAKEMYRSEVTSSALMCIGKNIDKIIASKRQENDPFKQLESIENKKYDIEKILKNDQTIIFSKLAKEIAAEEASIENISFHSN